MYEVLVNGNHNYVCYNALCVSNVQLKHNSMLFKKLILFQNFTIYYVPVH